MDEKTVFYANFGGSEITFTLGDCSKGTGCVKIMPKVVEQQNHQIPTEIFLNDSELSFPNEEDRTEICRYFECAAFITN